MVRLFQTHPPLSHGWPTPPYHSSAALDVGQLPTPLDNVTSALPMVCEVVPNEFHVFDPGSLLNPHSDFHLSFQTVLFELILLVLLTRTLRFLLMPLKQPRIVSEIIAGIIVGPSVLGQNKQLSDKLFPVSPIFVLKNIGIIGFMFFLFISGVKMDMSVVKKSDKKKVFIAVIGVLIPMISVALVGIATRKSMNNELRQLFSIGVVACAVALTAFPVLYPILEDLNLISSEVGKLSMSISVISDVIALNAIVIFEALGQAKTNDKAALWYVISTLILSAFIVTVVQLAAKWIVKKTPEGEAVSEGYIVGVLLAVFVSGFLTDMFGVAIGNGPLWLGLVIPDGPPLGSTLVERSEMIIMEILMPFSFACVGLTADVFAMRDVGWSSLAPLLAMTVTGYVTKLVATLLATAIARMPLRDGIVVSIIMSMRGQVELVLFIHWMDKKIIGVPEFTLMVLLTTAVTGVLAPFISIIYDPTKPYRISNRRTIQHTPQDSELRILLCTHETESVPGLIQLLQVSHPTAASPFSLFGLHFIELVGRAAPIFVDHQESSGERSNYRGKASIQNALKLFQQCNEESVKLHLFTIWAPKRTMYQDICKLALDYEAHLILLPFRRTRIGYLAMAAEESGGGMQLINSNVFAHSPCSVAVLVENGSLLLSQNFVVLFLGGADAREALAYADRMAANPEVSVTVIRFLSENEVGDDELEKKMDDGVVMWFWVKNEMNDRVVYREVTVKNGAETAAAINAINTEGGYDLWIVGRKHGINPVLVEGLAEWSENQEELGVVGDYVASLNFAPTSSVLVVQQQVMRGQEAATMGCFERSMRRLVSRCGVSSVT